MPAQKGQNKRGRFKASFYSSTMYSSHSNKTHCTAYQSPFYPYFPHVKTVNAKFYTPTVKQLPIFSSFFNLKCEANGKQCDFSFFLPFFFICCISILYGLLVLLFVFPLIIRVTICTNQGKGLSGEMRLVKIIMTNVIITNFLLTIVWMWVLMYIVPKRKGVWEFGISVFITCTAG